MITLVFDTCFNKSYIVLKKDGEILSNIAICSDDKNYHSVYLIPKIRDILVLNNLLFSDINAIGVNIGPGSFTGIRAGITIARVIAQQANIKLIGVNSLYILSKLNTSDKNAVVVTDARKNKVYFAEYIGNSEIVSPNLIEKEKIISKLSGKFVISDNSICKFLEENSISSLNYEENDENIGLYLDELTTYFLTNKNDDFHWAKIKPLYIQQPSITKPKELNNV